MRSKYLVITLKMIWLLLLMQPLTAYAEDIALVVGVDTYTGLDPNRYPNLEGAAVNTVPLVSDALRRNGFRVIVLVNQDARKEVILARIKELGGAARSSDRFVFYFLGHGSRALDRPVILPSDALESSDRNDISRDELATAMSMVTTQRRTVLLDSCWSGAMITVQESYRRDTGRLLPMYYDRPRLNTLRRKAAGQSVYPRLNQDSNRAISGSNAGVACYFTASGEEPAYSGEFNGKMQGVFSVFLVQRLGQNSASSWGDLQAQVAADVAQRMQGTQHPRLSEAYQKVKVFEGLNGPDPMPHPLSNLWEFFNRDRQMPGAVLLRIEPDRSTLAIGEEFKLKVMIGDRDTIRQDMIYRGKVYLVVIENGTRGKFNLIDLLAGDEKARYLAVDPAQAVNLGRFVANEAGKEWVKAFLFAQEADARHFVEQFTTSDLSVLDARRISDVYRKPVLDFFTSSIVFEVHP